MSDRGRTGNYYYQTGFSTQGNRRAGFGMFEDDYSEESGKRKLFHKIENVRFPSDRVEPEDLNGECIIVQPGNKKRKDGSNG